MVKGKKFEELDYLKGISMLLLVLSGKSQNDHHFVGILSLIVMLSAVIL